MESVKFSSIDRAAYLDRLQNISFDLLVIGGGITGAGIALDAASRGLKVALIEKDDFASGTSSRSTKLVHGGLRYLEHLELALVHEVGHERDVVYRNAAHVVRPEKMILPIIEGGSLGEFTTSMALYVYDFLAGVKKEENRQMLDLEETLAKEPLLENDKLRGGALYYEYKTDDSRLTIEVLKKAKSYGATLLNYVEFKEFVYGKKGRVKSVIAEDCLQNKRFKIKAKQVINATGPWVDKIRKIDNSLKNKRLHHTKGVHIVVSKERFPLNHSIYFDVGDNRMIFAIPRIDVVYIGTTDTDYKGEYEEPSVTKEDVDYLLAAINNISPKAKLEFKDVESAWAGLRPLIHEDGKSPSELSRKDETFVSDSGLISIAGGKLTGYRLMAKDIVNRVVKRFNKKYDLEIGKSITKNLRLSGGDFPFYPDKNKIIEFADSKYDEAKQIQTSAIEFKKLFYRYGTNVEIITNKAYEFRNETKDNDLSWIKAELWYGVHYEMVQTLADFFIRRTGMIHFHIHDIEPVLDVVVADLVGYLGWSEEQKDEEVTRFKQLLVHATKYE